MSSLGAVRGGTARDIVYAELRRRLTTGAYSADAALVPGVLSAEFDVSRTPVREALGLLEQEGLLRATSRGFVLRSRSESELVDIFETRGVLDAAAAAAAADRRDDIDLHRLYDLTERARTESDPTEVRRLFNGWHEALRLAARNATIAELLQTLDAQAKVSAPWRPDEKDRSFDDRCDEHEAILRAVVARDAEAARSLMLEHMRRDHEVRVRSTVGPRQPGSVGA
ncbi:GntR family transcriptional regulator [Gordonia soli]|uniref:Putative GntR family transcriptional regulator n=1 Tax=Gordonia soli NBRC 108243 TaxID=1223545 RepID=M0QMA0_9ACTN|nr:GntR family transcriptional regulator [Gordonia soli]GAC69708.1 putative GntR family transcriptional regulator [Gordonia soli NBRC 108243]